MTLKLGDVFIKGDYGSMFLYLGNSKEIKSYGVFTHSGKNHAVSLFSYGKLVLQRGV